jgi:hypothetical protein
MRRLPTAVAGNDGHAGNHVTIVECDGNVRVSITNAEENVLVGEETGMPTSRSWSGHLNRRTQSLTFKGRGDRQHAAGGA